MTPSPVIPDDIKATISTPTATLCGNFVNTLLKLPTLVYKIFAWMLTSTGTITNVFKQHIVPPGTVVPYAGSTAPDDWLLCQGQAILREDYPDLFSVIGILYGPGNGTTTFNIPDGRARTIVGVGTFESGATADLGGNGGAEKHTLALTEMPKHKHVGGSYSRASGSYDPQTPDFLMGKVSVKHENSGHTSAGANESPIDLDGELFMDEKGADAAHNNLQPYFVCNWIIKT